MDTTGLAQITWIDLHLSLLERESLTVAYGNRRQYGSEGRWKRKGNISR